MQKVIEGTDTYHYPCKWTANHLRPGEVQADFGEADFYENGRLHHGHYLNLSFPYSNQGYFQLFKGENQ
jgi:hypothetical protein